MDESMNIQLYIKHASKHIFIYTAPLKMSASQGANENNDKSMCAHKSREAQISKRMKSNRDKSGEGSFSKMQLTEGRVQT